MAKRSDLRNIVGAEVDDAVITKLLDYIHAEVDTVRDARDDFKKQLDEATRNLEAAQQAQQQAEQKLQQNITEAAARETRGAKEQAFKALLNGLGVSEKRIAAIMKVTAVDDIELDKAGAIKGVDKLTESIKQDYAEFIPATGEIGADVSSPPAGSTGGKMTKEQIMAITDKAERRKAIAENADLFR